MSAGMQSQRKLIHEQLPNIEINLVEVTPELAKEWLGRIAKNQRNISPPSVERYATDMITYDWAFTGAPILFNAEGELIDGQHRLSAIVTSDETQIMIVITGLDTEVMRAIDTGRRRSFADILKMRNVRNSVVVAAITSRLWQWEHGNYGCRGVGRVPNANFLTATPSTAQLDDVRTKTESELGVTLEQSGIFAARATALMPRGITASSYGLFWILLSRIDVDLREQFFHELLIEPKATSVEYPINALRHRLSRLGTDKLENPQQLHFLALAFNAWVKGRPLATLRKATPPRWDTLAQPARLPK